MSVLTTGSRALLAAAGLFLVAVLLLATPPATADFNSTSDDEHSTVGGSPNAVVAADFNQDGLDDVAATTTRQWSGPDAARRKPFGVTVLLSKPDGTYGPANYYPLGVHVRQEAVAELPCCPLAEAGELGAADLTIADVNGDPFMDLVAINAWDDSASVLINTGTGRFGPAVSNPPPPDEPNPDSRDFPPPDSSLADIKGSAPHEVAAGDLDGDGDEDLVTANAHSDNVSVLLNAPSSSGGSPETGVYQEKSDSPYTINGTGPRGVAIADLNGDGDVDVVTANKNSDDVSVLLNNGSGGLTTVKGPFGVGTDPTAVATEQLDSDSYPDVVVPNSGDDNVSVLLNDGSGNLSGETSSPYSVGSAPVDVVLGDLGGSTDIDLAVANRGDNNVTVRRGDGTGDFSTEESNSPYKTGGPPGSLTSGNFDPPSIAGGAVSPNPSDVDPDLATGNHDAIIKVLHNK